MDPDAMPVVKFGDKYRICGPTTTCLGPYLSPRIECQWKGLSKIDSGKLESHMRAQNGLRIEVGPLHHPGLKSLNYIDARSGDVVPCSNCSLKMWSSPNAQNKKLHETRCKKYKRTVKELRSLLAKVSVGARNVLENHVATKFDLSRFYALVINEDQETDDES